MLDLAGHLRFLLADDAGAGKTIMAGLLIREMLLRRMVRRVLVVAPAGLVGNWQSELQLLFRLRFQILSSAAAENDHNPFSDPRYNLAIISVDTLWRDRMRAAYLAAPPYDLVIFDEAHKLSASRNVDLTINRTRRYEMAEQIAAQNRHLLLMTATPHMGKDDAYYLLWRLLEPELFAAEAAFKRLGGSQKRRYLLRRMKEEMVSFDGMPILPPRESNTIAYPLRPSIGQEQDLYTQVTRYCDTYYDLARQHNRSAARLAMGILQRRQASSTWGVYNSLRRRAEALGQMVQEMDARRLTDAEVEELQRRLPDRDIHDTMTGDEEESQSGEEESERQDAQVLSATAARTLRELRSELVEVQRLVNLARTVVLRDPAVPAEGAEPEVVAEQVTGVRRFAAGRCKPAPARLLLALHPAPADALDRSQGGSLADVQDTAPVVVFLVQSLGQPALEKQRREEEARLPEGEKQLRVAYNLRQAKLLTQRRQL